MDNLNIKRGLRNQDGSGVLAGATKICTVHGYVIDDGEKKAIDGELIYRGYDIVDLINGFTDENRFGFEETVWLLLLGKLPTKEQLNYFSEIIADYRELPNNFTEDMIFKAPSPNIMNKMARSVLALYSYEDNPEDNSLENVIRQSIQLIARIPVIMTNALQIKMRVYNQASMYFHHPKKELSIAENILRMTRPDKKFTDEEAKLLDLCLVLHAEHGGGNNSTFSTRVLTSSGTDTYAAIAAGIGSLKGPKHGGANAKVMEMLSHIEANVSDYDDEQEIRSFLCKIASKQAGDRSGLIYGMGHAVYTKSDPRAIIIKQRAMDMAKGTEIEAKFKILNTVERLAPEVLCENNPNFTKEVCANVDMYSGLVYRLLGIPDDLHTPLFAVARMPGWCAHRLEELTTCNRIIRPAYKAIAKRREYIPLNSRNV